MQININFIILFLIFMVQEPITSSLAIANALNSNFDFMVIFIIFISATILDILIGYSIGFYIRKRKLNNKISLYLDKITKKAQIKKDNLNLFSYSIFVIPFFPYSTLLSGLFGIGFKKAVIIHLLGEIFLWFSFVYSAAIGLKYFSNNILNFILVFVLVVFILKILYFKMRHKKEL